MTVKKPVNTPAPTSAQWCIMKIEHICGPVSMKCPIKADLQAIMITLFFYIELNAFPLQSFFLFIYLEIPILLPGAEATFIISGFPTGSKINCQKVERRKRDTH